MRIANLAVTALLICGSAARADAPAPIHILATGLAASGISVLGNDFMRDTGTVWENGPNHTLVTSTAGQIQKALADGVPADVIILPTDTLDAMDKAGQLMPGTNKKLGRADFGVAVRTGAPHPDISTFEKFRDALVNARAVAHTDPKLGSAGGAIIADFLARPEFSGIKKTVLSGNGAASVASGDADIAIETLGTLLPTYGVELIGLVPASLNAHVYFSIAVLANAPSPAEAVAFEKYALRPAAAPVWKKWGIVR